MTWYEFKKKCVECGDHNHWVLPENNLKPTDFICTKCNQVQIKFNNEKDISISAYCTHCNFYNEIIFETGMPLKLRQFECPRCSYYDLTFGMTLGVEPSPYDYDVIHTQRI